jgi:hypothetical protein
MTITQVVVTRLVEELAGFVNVGNVRGAADVKVGRRVDVGTI